MNLLVNAIDAIEDRLRRGTLSAQPEIQISTQFNNNSKHISISITDNGIGISPEVGSQLFDPFFTTKTIGKGTGMGLAISYQIVTERHHGTLQCISQPNQGATFIITIPIR
jgi:signal transduction histidine kinase